MPKILKDVERKILDASMRVIENEGIEKLNIRYISKIAGIGLGTTYNYFKNKDEIILRCIEIYWKKAITDLKNRNFNNNEDFLDILYSKIYKYQFLFKDFWKNHELLKIPQKRFHMINELKKIILEKSTLDNPEFIIQNLMATAVWDFIKYEEVKKILLERMG
ncbi:MULTISPECIES: TetR/AcrR family transcriptional regulator [unclassified Marinitoga]|uniref:TetR/AcrR family transcriptional regulator n=1 Tax=unclassified Marinitoga TaxID=2640159 RepID=UPI00095247B5|nr:MULTISPECIES: TetR/AcrR family transcriptional regulator [unclassified Marinitoga]